jgi:acyl-coenzyme A thioesterase PaaI-like protein
VGVTHHQLCFGCGLANVFGLQIELERESGGTVAGRFFVKQDHQGRPGFAHGGVLAAALDEAAGLAAGEGTEAPIVARLEVDLLAPAPVGSFVRLRASVEREEPGKRWVVAEAFGEQEHGPPLARATALLVDG